MKLSDYVVDFLVAQKVSHVFEVAGGAISHLLDSFYDRKDISLVTVHHEQAASFAAEGYARAGRKIGVAIATSGPGATNLITGIGSCYFDSVPALFITGQVNTYEFKRTNLIRQAGFQETDIVNIVKPIVKYAVMVRDPKLIRYYLEKAAFLSRAGRPGPVLIDIPLDVQRAEIEPDMLKGFTALKGKEYKSDQRVEKTARLIKKAKRPIILIGGGARIADAQAEVLDLAHRTGMPIVSTLLGKDLFPNDFGAYLGMLGTYGNRSANLAVANSDLLLILGARLDTRQTGNKPATFARESVIIHVDIDQHELNNKVKADLPIRSDVKVFLHKLLPLLTDCDRAIVSDWVRTVNNYKKSYYEQADKRSRGIKPNNFFKELYNYLPADAIICADIGQNQMWAAQSLVVKKKQRFITQGGMGAMGSALSLGIGAAFAEPGRTIVVISGDGGFQLNAQELQTVKYYKLPIKIILLNNNCYGMVRQFQEQYFDSRFQSTVRGYNCPDFQKIVSAYGIQTAKLSAAQAVVPALKKCFSFRLPAFLEVNIDQRSLVEPKLGLNQPLENQEPFLPHKELAMLMKIKIAEEKKARL